MIDNILSEPFQPPFLFKKAFIQTYLASFKLRAMGKNRMVSKTREMIMDTAGGVRLQWVFSPQTGHAAKGLVILLHGWEGSADSTYIRTTGRLLYRNGYHIFRLNLRDHGQSHYRISVALCY